MAIVGPFVAKLSRRGRNFWFYHHRFPAWLWDGQLRDVYRLAVPEGQSPVYRRQHTHGLLAVHALSPWSSEDSSMVDCHPVQNGNEPGAHS